MYVENTQTNNVPAPQSLVLDEQNISVAVGMSRCLWARVQPTDAGNYTINWSSSNPSVASVSNGNVTAHATGPAVISAWIPGTGLSVSCNVEVTPFVPVDTVSVAPETASIVVNGILCLEAQVSPTNASTPFVTWSSADESVASVGESSGQVYARKAGSTIITATARNGEVEITDSCVVSVFDPIPVTGVLVEQKNVTLVEGQKYQLRAVVSPADATNKSVIWFSNNDRIAKVGAGTGLIEAVDGGTATITATTQDGNFVDCVTVQVRSTDPFHETNVEYVRIKNIPSKKTTNGLTYTDCVITVSVTKSYLDDLTYFTAYFPDENQITTFEINDTLINKLNALEQEYNKIWGRSDQSVAFHSGKLQADILVEKGTINANSPEYYGIWAYNGNSYAAVGSRLDFAFALTSICYAGFMYGYTTILNMHAKQMLPNQSKTLTHNQYLDNVQSQKYIADISDDVAVQMGKTDVTTVSGARRNWRGSEMRAAENYSASNGYLYNRSYKVIDGELTVVPHGTAGSQRPDFYNPTTGHLVEVKNYTITTSSGRNSLANNITNQYNNRVNMFPDATIEFRVDVYGQAYTQDMLDDVLNRVRDLLGNSDMVSFITN